MVVFQILLGRETFKASSLVSPTSYHLFGGCTKPSMSSSIRGSIPSSQLWPFKHQSFQKLMSSSLGGCETKFRTVGLRG